MNTIDKNKEYILLPNNQDNLNCFCKWIYSESGITAMKLLKKTTTEELYIITNEFIKLHHLLYNKFEITFWYESNNDKDDDESWGN